MANHSGNHSYLKDRLGFDPDELDELCSFDPEKDDFVSPSHKKFKSHKPSPSSSTSSVKDNYEISLNSIKGKERKSLQNQR